MYGVLKFQYLQVDSKKIGSNPAVENEDHAGPKPAAGSSNMGSCNPDISVRLGSGPYTVRWSWVEGGGFFS
jgi:hypothetical protein